MSDDPIGQGSPATGEPSSSAALVTVYEFIARLEVASTMTQIVGRSTGPESLHPAALANVESAILDSLAGVAGLARRYDDDLAARIEGGVNGEDGYPAAVAATQELVGWIRSGERHRPVEPAPDPLPAPAAATVPPSREPCLALDDLHPWVGPRAVGLWTDHHRESAIAVVASDLFEVHLPDKLRVAAAEPERLVTLAFGKHHRGLKIPAYPTPGEDQDDAYQAASKLGAACAKLLRLTDRITDVVRDDDVLFEELAMLSRFARLVDEG
jgi:hypothetical protein